MQWLRHWLAVCLSFSWAWEGDVGTAWCGDVSGVSALFAVVINTWIGEGDSGGDLCWRVGEEWVCSLAGERWR